MKYATPEPPAQPCLHLTDKTLIGRGNKRDCHAHPDNPDRCIKVVRHAERSQECQEQNIVEWHYTNHLKRRRVPLEHTADCFGWVNTNHGAGLVVERIRESGSTPALTLRQALTQGRIDANRINRMLADLQKWAIEHAVVVADLNTDNLMIRNSNGKDRFVFIDGLGSRKADWKFTLYQRLPAFARFKTRRQWKRQEISLFKTVEEITARLR